LAGTSSIPYGFCHCGCGEKTPVAAKTDSALGWVKGEPKRYIARHYKPPVQDEKTRFESKVSVDDNGCWEWEGCYKKERYGAFRLASGKTTSAHRAAYQIFKGPIPEGMCILHACDNRWCVSPAHLRVGTLAENTQEAIQRGRLKNPPRHEGKTHPRARLTEEQVLEIRDLVDQGWRQTDIARAYGTPDSNVNKISKREAWSHLKEKEPSLAL